MTRIQDLLGMNARNLLYVRPLNKRNAKRRADDKILTKKILQEAKVPTKKLLGVIPDHIALESFDWNQLPGTFVLKPARGYGGGGIVVINKKIDATHWEDTSGTTWSMAALDSHIRNILDGDFSLSRTPDVAFFEEKISMDPAFRRYSYKGLPDVRVIVFNNVPVMAMLRLPTKQSDGKANLMKGAVGVGVDLATGTTTSAIIEKPWRKTIAKHPDTHETLAGFEIPHWDEILTLAIKTQRISGLGYLGADIIVDKFDGPVVIEINARPGLEIQNVNRAGLARRLERVAGITVENAAQGIRIAKDLFASTSSKPRVDVGKRVIGLSETVEIIRGDGRRVKVLARVDTGSNLSIIDKTLLAKIDTTLPTTTVDHFVGKQFPLQLVLRDTTLNIQAKVADHSDNKSTLVLGTKDLKDFYIDPSRRVNRTIDLKRSDSLLVDLRNSIVKDYFTYFRPTNLKEEKKKFMDSDDYNPHFVYKKIDWVLDEVLEKINAIPTDTSPLGILLGDKKKELALEAKLLAYRNRRQSYTETSIALFGKPDATLLKQVHAVFAKQKNKLTERAERVLMPEDAKTFLTDRLLAANLPQWSVEIAQRSVSRLLVSMGQQKIYISEHGKWSSKRELEATAAHEIDTHIFRYENGMQQAYRVFRVGTAGSLVWEEGLAMYAALVADPESTNHVTAALKVIAVDLALKKSFRDTYKELARLTGNKTLAWATTLRVKRGIVHTEKPGAWTRELIYFKGLSLVQQLAKEHPEQLPLLYRGKIKPEDVVLLNKMKSTKPAKYLPGFLQ